MDKATKALLEIENQKLLNIRQKLGHSAGPKPIAEVDISPVSSEIARYFEAITSGADPGNPKEVVSGNLAKWNAFNWDIHPDLKKAKKIIIEWSKTEVGKGSGLILAGDCGCGKSHIAEAIAKARGPMAQYVNEIDLIKSIQATYDSNDKTEEGILLRYKRASLLIYDDLGTYETDKTNWLQGIYYALFNQRQEKNQDIIITTNLPLIDHVGNSPLEDWLGARLFSRIIGQVDKMKYYINLFDVPDYRLRNLEIDKRT